MNIVVKVGAILRNEHGQILLIKERYEKGGELKWNIIKGTYDDACETLDECVRREIKEEAGVVVDTVVLRQVYHYGHSSDTAKILFIFSAGVLSKDVFLPSVQEQKMRGEEIEDFKWFSTEDLKIITEQDFVASYAFRAALDQDSFFDKTPIKIVNIAK